MARFGPRTTRGCCVCSQPQRVLEVVVRLVRYRVHGRGRASSPRLTPGAHMFPEVLRQGGEDQIRFIVHVRHAGLGTK
jgi:hypothetical protein